MIVDKIALILVIVGALNWGGVGLFGFDTVAWIVDYALGRRNDPAMLPPSQTKAYKRCGSSYVLWTGWQVSGASRCCSATRRTTPATRLTQPEPFNKKEHLTVLFFPVIFRFADASPSPPPG